jgi:Carboxypeptidase regulatory-like domain
VEVRGGDQSHAGRQVDIPDTDRFELDIALGAASVSGIVVDRESGAPVPDASVSLRSSDGKGPGGSDESGADGRFAIAADPGEYELYARALDRAPATQRLSVGSGGLSDVRVELERGHEIGGRLVDSSGRPAAGILITVTPADGGGHANSGADGAFRFGGLVVKPYAIVAGSELGGYAVRPSVLPGGELVMLTLQPAGRVLVRVVDAASQPVPNAFPRVETVDGALVRLPGRTSGPTDPDGRFTLSCPSGVVGVVTRDAKRLGRASVAVAPGATVPLTIVMSADESQAQ